MQILGELIRLPPNLRSLPLPWWYRAPLGLLHGTNVNVALVTTNKRPVGDLVVSVLEPDRWDRIMRLECTAPDQPGLIATILEAVYPLNVALAEAVTIETGDSHQVTVICESGSEELTKPFLVPIKERLERAKLKVRLDPFFEPVPLRVKWKKIVTVEHGWLHGLDDLAPWIEKEFTPGARELVDMSAAVVSADTEKRLLRYVFPLKGAKTIKVIHPDEPGTLREIIRVIAEFKLNVLSAFLRRGGQQQGEAELVCVFEPVQGQDLAGLDDRLIAALGKNPVLRPKIRAAVDPQKVVYARDPVIGRRVYLSRRFMPTNDATTILPTLSETLRQNGHLAVRLDGSHGSIDHIKSKIWSSEAGIIPVVESPGVVLALLDLAHEVGFFQADHKPVLLLVDATAATFEMLSQWSRSVDIHCERFDRQEQKNEVPTALRVIVPSWLATIRG